MGDIGRERKRDREKERLKHTKQSNQPGHPIGKKTGTGYKKKKKKFKLKKKKKKNINSWCSQDIQHSVICNHIKKIACKILREKPTLK